MSGFTQLLGSAIAGSFMRRPMLTVLLGFTLGGLLGGIVAAIVY